MGAGKKPALRVTFDRRLKLEFHGSKVTSGNVAGETDQDWGEGGAPFPADHLPDGGSGGSARIVPDHFGTNWTAEMGNRNVRMKANHVKTNGNPGRGVFKSYEKVCGKSQLPANRSLYQRKTEFGPEKRLANLWSTQKITKITKRAFAGRWREAI